MVFEDQRQSGRQHLLATSMPSGSGRTGSCQRPGGQSPQPRNLLPVATGHGALAALVLLLLAVCSAQAAIDWGGGGAQFYGRDGQALVATTGLGVLVSVHAGELLDFTALLPSNPADLITPGRALSDGLGNESLVLGTSGSFVSGYLMNSMVPDLSQAEQAGYGAATGERLFLVVWDRTTFAGQAPASGAALCVVPLWVDGDPATPATTYGDLPPSLPTWAKPATGATQFRCDQTLVPATEFALTLTVGWNLISLPVTPLAPAPETCFGSAVAGAVWEWQTGRNGGAYGQSTALAPGRGYWVEGTVAGPVVIRGRAPPPQSLGLGSSAWHLLGPLSSRPLTVARDGPTAGSLWRWDGMSQAYRSVDIAATLEVGSGYWFYAASDVTLTLDVDGRGTR